MSNKAKEILIPKEKGIFRLIFLYVGQGESTLLVIPSGGEYKFALIDSNADKSLEGIDLIKMLDDLLDDELDVYINTHPHKDHLGIIKEIYNTCCIKEVWHSGHKPGGDHKDSYSDFENVMNKLEKDNVYRLRGTNKENFLDEKEYRLGDINYQVLAPADYVSDEIENEKPEERYNRIHEQSGVIRFSYGKDPTRIMITGDSDLKAWKDHITEYHKSRLSSNVLSASHHGSRTFFKEKEDDESYTDHLKEIAPTYLIISAPKEIESPHDHPHKDALKEYRNHIDKDNIFHLGDYKGKRICVIVDIDSEGELSIKCDEELHKNYSFKSDDDGDKSKGEKIGSVAILTHTKLDDKPMG